MSDLQSALGLVCLGFFVLAGAGFAVFAFVGSRLVKQSKESQAAVRASWITRHQFESIRLGMSLAEVVNVVGRPGEEVAANRLFDADTVAYQWPAGHLARAILTFQNGKLAVKDQVGL
jgi:hypothetical protein